MTTLYHTDSPRGQRAVVPTPSQLFPFLQHLFLVPSRQEQYISVNAFLNPAISLSRDRKGAIPMLTSFNYQGTNSSCSLLNQQRSQNSTSLGTVSPDTSTQVYSPSLILMVTELTASSQVYSGLLITAQEGSHDYSIQLLPKLEFL